MRRIIAMRRLHDDEGSQLVEFAITCGVFFTMLFGIFEATLAMYLYHITSDAAREATRYAIVRGSTSCINTPNLSNCNATAANIASYVQGLGFPGVKSSNVSVSTSWYTASTSEPTPSNPTTWSACSTGTCNAPGNMVQVTVTYPMTFNIPFSNPVTLNINSSSQMVIAQ